MEFKIQYLKNQGIRDQGKGTTKTKTMTMTLPDQWRDKR